jgi:glycosyltransferase involved in cell wall biosynthesis
MPLVSFITTCMGRLAHLQRALPTWLAQPDSEVVVVDFSCPDSSGDWVEAHHPGVKVVRLPGRSHFNPSAGRNAGAAAAASPWLGFIDADVLLSPDLGGTIFPQLEEGTYWRVDGGPADLMGTVLVPREAFAGVEGYDEALEGWGNEDSDLYKRLRWRGLRRGSIPPGLVSAIPHDDAMRVEHMRIQNRGTGWLLNRTYLEAKWQFMRLEERNLPLEERRELYLRVGHQVLDALDRGGLPDLEFSLGWQRMLPGLEIERRFSLRLRSAAAGG